MPKDTTTFRLSRRTHQKLRAVAAYQGRTVASLLDEWAERARRDQVLEQYTLRMEQLANAQKSKPPSRRSLPGSMRLQVPPWLMNRRTRFSERPVAGAR
jgi:hypothetical protein